MKEIHFLYVFFFSLLQEDIMNDNMYWKIIPII